MVMHSMLFETPAESAAAAEATEPGFFGDLNLDQVVEAVASSRVEYDLKPFFYTPLHSVEAIEYRHEVFRDLENQDLRGRIAAFAEKMRSVRAHIARSRKVYYANQKERYFLDATILYCEAVGSLAAGLSESGALSRGFAAFRRFLDAYVASETLSSLDAEARAILQGLAELRYCIIIDSPVIKVRNYEIEIDYSADVERTFAKFKQGEVKSYLADISDRGEMNHIEARILDLVAQLNPELFARLHLFCSGRADFLDDTIAAFDREIQFYLAYLEHAGRLKASGLPFCYPRIVEGDKEIFASASYDLALANKLLTENATVVCNDFFLRGPERIIVVSGPNQGGKTTFARAFGQLHFLACLGCPVPAKDARLFLFNRLFTHFEREENGANLRGKLQDDLERMRAILESAGADSIIVLNELFNSTTLSDAVFLGKEIMRRMMGLDLICVYVTFLDELASMGAQTVSMVSTVVPDNPAERTFKIRRLPADGLAYARSIAEKHRLTYEDLKERIPS